MEFQQIALWPAEDIDAAFKRMNAAIGTPEEARELKIFAGQMNFFYSFAEYMNGEIDPEHFDTLYDMAKKSLYMELGIEPMLEHIKDIRGE